MSKLVSSNGYRIKKKVLEYQCGCKYSFQDYTRLEHVCFAHENELIAQCGSNYHYLYLICSMSGNYYQNSFKDLRTDPYPCLDFIILKFCRYQESAI